MTRLVDETDMPVVLRCVRPADCSHPARMVLLHGLATSSTSWDEFLPRADPGIEVWVADMPWRGGGVDDWALRPNVADWVARVFDSIPGHVDILVAHSFAANAVLQYLDGLDPFDESGDRVELAGLRGVVLVSPFYRRRSDDFRWETISYYLNDFDKILADGLRVRSPRTDPHMREDLARRVRDRVGPHGWMRFFDTYLRTPQLRLERLTGPVLVVGGETDFAAFPEDSHTLAVALPNATAHVLGECGHFAMAEAPEAFARSVNEFVRTVLVRNGGAAEVPGTGQAAPEHEVERVGRDRLAMQGHPRRGVDT